MGPRHGLQGPSDADELAKPRISCYSSAHRPACQSSTSCSGSYLSPTPTNPRTSRAGRIGPPPACGDIEVRATGPRLWGAASTCLPWQPREDGTKQRAQLASISQAPATTAPASRSSLHTINVAGNAIGCESSKEPHAAVDDNGRVANPAQGNRLLSEAASDAKAPRRRPALSGRNLCPVNVLPENPLRVPCPTCSLETWALSARRIQAVFIHLLREPVSSKSHDTGSIVIVTTS